MNIQPLHDRVIIKRTEPERTTASGIVLPDAGEKPNQGVVVAVGPGKRNNQGARDELDVLVGDRVLFGKFAGQSIKVDGHDVLIMAEEEILAKLM